MSMAVVPAGIPSVFGQSDATSMNARRSSMASLSFPRFRASCVSSSNPFRSISSTSSSSLSAPRSEKARGLDYPHKL